jgi:predicted cupin superfamily sugar epimerase
MKPFAKGTGNMFVESWEEGLLTYAGKIRILVDPKRTNWAVVNTITYEGSQLSCVVAGGSDFESNFELTDPELVGDGI